MAVLVALLGVAGTSSAGAAAPAYFPVIPPATQITRELTLPQAAQAGAVKLQAKGGSEGDAVSLEVVSKKVKAPIVITVRVEMTVEPRLTPEKRALVRELVPDIAAKGQADLNRKPIKTKSGDPITFKLEYVYREPEAASRSGYHQVKLINPQIDKPGDPDFRSEVDALVPPNTSATTSGNWTLLDMKSPQTIAHETLHLVGLDDRYTDVYAYNGKQYPLPRSGMSPAELKAFLAGHKPPLPPPPAGKVDAINTPGTEKCDVMGVGFELSCRKISPRDLEWLEANTGLLVTAQPGETLLNKSADHQNFGVGFQTIVFAAPGSTTLANGVAVYCLDHDRFLPLDQVFDVGPTTAQQPGYESIGKLLALNSAKQPNLTESIAGMQAAIWNLSDASPLATSGLAEEARALMAEAGVAENSIPGGLPAIADPNAASAATGAVDAAGAILPPLATEAITPPPSFRFYTAALYPKTQRAGGKLRGDLLLGASGQVEEATIVIQRKKGKRWKKQKALPAKAIEAGTAPLGLSLGRLAPGKYRLQVTVNSPYGEQQTLLAPFTVKP